MRLWVMQITWKNCQLKLWPFPPIITKSILETFCCRDKCPNFLLLWNQANALICWHETIARKKYASGRADASSRNWNGMSSIGWDGLVGGEQVRQTTVHWNAICYISAATHMDTHWFCNLSHDVMAIKDTRATHKSMTACVHTPVLPEKGEKWHWFCIDSGAAWEHFLFELQYQCLKGFWQMTHVWLLGK